MTPPALPDRADSSLPARAHGASRRVVLVELYWTRDKDPRVPLGHASILASLARDPSERRNTNRGS